MAARTKGIPVPLSIVVSVSLPAVLLRTVDVPREEIHHEVVVNTASPGFVVAHSPGRAIISERHHRLLVANSLAKKRRTLHTMHCTARTENGHGITMMVMVMVMVMVMLMVLAMVVAMGVVMVMVVVMVVVMTMMGLIYIRTYVRK